MKVWKACPFSAWSPRLQCETNHLVTCRGEVSELFHYRIVGQSLKHVFKTNVCLQMINSDTLWPSLARVNKYFILLCIKSFLVYNKCAIHFLQLVMTGLTVEGFHSCLQGHPLYVTAKQWCTNCREWCDQFIISELLTTISISAGMLMNS